MKRIVLMWVAACVACGSSDGGSDAGTTGGSGTATGTVNGHSLNVKDAVFAADTSLGITTLALADRTDVCTLLKSSTPPTGATTALVLGLANLGPASIPVGLGTGTYNWNDLNSLPPPGLYWAGSFGVGTGCTLTNTTDATGGTVTITQVGNTTGTHLKGSYNGTFGSDTLSGTFDAVYCDAVVNPGAGCPNLRAGPVVFR
jgi:hypothetical protein